MKTQFINDSTGVPQYVVLPIEEYKKLATAHIPVDTDDDEDWVDVEYDSDEYDDVLIPHEVVSLMVDKQISLLSAWRYYRGLTQSQVAKITGIKQANLSNMEKMGTPPHLSILKKIAKAYNCKPEQLTS